MTRAITYRFLAFFAFLMMIPAIALAGNHTYEQFGTALRGYDAVAYQTEDRAVEGSTEFAVQHNGLTYLFASQANADTFKGNPSKYEPAYNGYCAMGVAMGKKLPTDPQAFKVVDGKLYMNLNKKIQDVWMKDIPGRIEQANENWADIKDTHPADL